MPLPFRFPAFEPGKTLADGDLLRDVLNELQSSESGITARAGGGKATATPITSANNNVTVVASAADSVLLPAPFPGRRITLRNSAANAMQVFGSGSDTINAVATATGVSQATLTTAVYVCMSVTGGVGAWFRVQSA